MATTQQKSDAFDLIQQHVDNEIIRCTIQLTNIDDDPSSVSDEDINAGGDPVAQFELDIYNLLFNQFTDI